MTLTDAEAIWRSCREALPDAQVECYHTTADVVVELYDAGKLVTRHVIEMQGCTCSAGKRISEAGD